HDAAESADKVRQLYAEHAEIKIHLHALEDLIRDDSGWLPRVMDLRALIESHARDEEEREFPALRARLDDKATARLFGEVQREKAMIL
ncbi:MAG TPA: hemerythrin domain-containing protein, partial [Sphingomonadales bacterium]